MSTTDVRLGGTAPAPASDGVAAAGTARGQTLRRWATSRLALSFYSVSTFLIIWELVAVGIVRDAVFLPTPVATIETLVHYMGAHYPAAGPTLLGDIEVSMARILTGFAIGSVVGLTLGSLMAGLRPIRALVDPFIELTRPLPPLAFIPLLLIWLGLGEAPKVALIAGGVVPIVTVATAAALADVPAELMNAARCLGASELYIMRHVRARAAVPGIITGMRLAMGISWTSIVAAEFIAANSGLGYVIWQAGQFLRTSLVFAGLMLIAVLGISLDTLFRVAARALDPSKR